MDGQRTRQAGDDRHGAGALPVYTRPRSSWRKRLQFAVGVSAAVAAAVLALSPPWGPPSLPDAAAVTTAAAPTTTTSTTTTLPAEPSYRFVPEVPTAIFGVVTAGRPSGGDNPARLDRFTTEIGAPNVVGWFVKLTDGIGSADLQAAGERGAVPMITIEPWARGVDNSSAVEHKQVLTDLIAGAYDRDIIRTAGNLADFDGEVLIRWAHEANGDWYPWAAANGVHGPQLWLDAYRHVVDIFRAQGADNVRFVWGVNRVYATNTPLAEMFPGDDYVDYVGISGFWTADWSAPTAVDALFDPTIAEIAALTAKPIFLAETGVALGVDRGFFLRDLLDHSIRGDIAGWVWMEENKIRGDWRLLDDQASSELLRGLLPSWRTVGLVTGDQAPIEISLGVGS